ncbi:hypothetical protein KI387_022961 [Taxus chinensis]|uniref:Uncharacterized protein n=1 Tax=Taxus chinensis TaxID=29808 RepID=A0AA38G1C9_TAXCH|nr:hypothetical protein KI387_022961 [Taxus chinensis]
MGGQLKRLEPDNCDSVKNDGEVWNIMLENGIATFLERMAGYSALVSYAVTASWSKGRVQIGNTRFTISTNAIADATGLPAAGDIYFKRSLHAEIQDFNAPGDRPVKYLSGYTRDSLPPPWDRVAEVIMRYFTIDGRYRLVYGPHFFILSHLRWGKKINLAAFLFQSLEHSVQLARDGEGAILHQGTDASFQAASPVSSPDSSLAADILGLAKLYPDSPDSEQFENNQPVDDPITQSAGNNTLFDDKVPPADTFHSSPILDSTPAAPESADTQRDDCRVDMVSSILNKLQRAFKALKAWEAFTESTKTAIANDCSELINLAEQLANDSGSPRARTAVSELKKLL